MKRKQKFLKVSVLLAAIAMAPLVHPVMAGDLVPFKGVLAGGVTGVSFDFPFGTTLSTAEGEATHLGHYTITGIVVVDVTSGAATGTFTMTAANGDMLFLDMAGHAVPTDLTKTVADFTATGGTGLFEGATGSFTADNQFGFAVNLPVSPNPYVAEIEGTIFTPGANKK